MKPAIYSASKIWFAPNWQRMRDYHGYNINATWIDIPCGTPNDPTGAKLLTDEEKCQLWIDCSNEASNCDLLICYAEKDNEQRGALVEIGHALGNGNPCYLIGTSPTFQVAGHSDVAFMKHPLFHKVETEGSQEIGFDYVDGYRKAMQHYMQNYTSIRTERVFLHEGFTSGQSGIQQKAVTDSLKFLRTQENTLYKVN
jgi:hypothetical protein